MKLAQVYCVAHTAILFCFAFPDAPIFNIPIFTPGYASFGRSPGAINIRHLQCQVF